MLNYKAKIFKHSSIIHKPDKKLIILIFIILAAGLVMLSSASAVIAYSNFGDAYYYFKHQLIGLALGLIAFFIFSRIDYRIWRQYASWFLIGSIILLLLVFIPGLKAKYGNAQSWINIFGFSLQPSEFVKLFFLLYLAAWLEARKEKLHNTYQGTLPFIISLGVIALLMLLQPDLGTLIIIAITSLVVYYVGGGKLWHIILIILIALLSLLILIQIKPYQMNRFRCVFNPGFSRNDVCYQTNQSLIAIGSGGIWGRGLGESRQKYMYLPEATGDSIFAIIAEETGFFFCIILIICYFILFYKGYQISKHAPDDFGKILAIGIVSWIAIQAIINIGGTINLFPLTGVPLPLISYGGTAILASLAALGILVNISSQTKSSN